MLNENHLGEARRLRIAMLAPVSWPVPPDGYGPWEQVVSNITEELVAAGHEVTLFAAAGSQTTAKLVATVPHSFSHWPAGERNAPRGFDAATGLLLGPPDFRAWEQMHIATCMEAAMDGGFDLVHSHLHVHALVFSGLIPCPLVSSLHGAAWVAASHPVFERYRTQPFVSLSNAERTLKPNLNYIATVHNGIQLAAFPLGEVREDFLLFAGRLSPEKGAAEAIAIAKLAGRPLRLAGMIEPQHQAYFDEKIRPHLDGSQISYIGLLSQRELVAHYQKTAALLFPISWCEPCSMVGIEAQACGAPIIGTRFGYLPELVEQGVTGFLVDTVAEAAACVPRLAEISSQACRENVARRFSAPVMAAGYVNAYRSVVAS